MAVIRKSAKDYAPFERLEIVMEGMQEGVNVIDISTKYNINRDTYYTWKNALMGTIEGLWGVNHAGRKKADEETENVDELKAKIWELERQKELAGLREFRNNLIIESLSDKMKKKYGIKK